jgi:hypothetical protein
VQLRLMADESFAGLGKAASQHALTADIRAVVGGSLAQATDRH